jgi:hypothetical protein
MIAIYLLFFLIGSFGIWLGALHEGDLPIIMRLVVIIIGLILTLGSASRIAEHVND